MTSQSVTGDTKIGLLAIGLCASLMASVLLLAPAIAGQLIVKFGFTEPQAGYTISAELAGVSLASFPAFYWLSRWNWHRVSYASLVAFAVGNVASSLTQDFGILATLRFLTGLGAGNVMLITMLAAAGARNSERSYSIWLVGQLVLGAVGLALLPSFFASYSLSIFYCALAILSLTLCTVVRFLPQRLPLKEEKSHLAGAAISPMIAYIGLAGLFLFYLTIGGTWTFVEQIGTNLEIDRQFIGIVLSVATVAGIVGALSVPLLSARLSRWAGILIGCGLLIMSILAFMIGIGWVEFTGAAIAFKFAWTFTIPFILAVLASLDYDGKIVAISNILIGLGLAVGPALASILLDISDGYTMMLIIMLLSVLLSTVLLVGIAVKKQVVQPLEVLPSS